MTLAEELREIAGILAMPTSPFHTEGARLNSIAARVSMVEQMAEGSRNAAEQWERAHNYAVQELEELTAALQRARA